MATDLEMAAEFELILSQLHALANPAWARGMAYGGIQGANVLGISIPNIRALAGRRKDHKLAQALWETGIHEARILAGLIDIPALVTPGQMDAWTADFDSWDVCDQVCLNLYVKTPYAVEKARQWAGDDREFVKRAGFALMACLAVHGKKLDDPVFEDFIPIIEAAAEDSRNFVKKAINWALRQIGKRNKSLYTSALLCSQRLAASKNPSARWVGSDALKELQFPSDSIRKRLNL